MKPLKKTDVILCFLLLFISGVGLAVWQGTSHVAENVVVSLEGKEIARISLTSEGVYGIILTEEKAVVEPYAAGTTYDNVFMVADGGVCMSDATCPDGLCVKKGMVTSMGMPIICLPHGITLLLQ